MIQKSSDIVRQVLLMGTGFEDGKQRVLDYFSTHKDNRAEFLRKEYGVGGWCWTGLSTDHDGKGLTVKDAPMSENKLFLSWSEVAVMISNLIDSGEYSVGLKRNGTFQLELK